MSRCSAIPHLSFRRGAELSVEELAASFGAAVAGQLIVGVFDRELVVVRELLPTADAARGEDDDVLLAVHGDHSGVAVRLAGVVDEAGGVAMYRGVHHLVLIDAKHVTAYPLMRGHRGQVLGMLYSSEDMECVPESYLSVVVFLTFVGQHGSNHVSRVFDHHFSGLNGFFAEKPTAVNRRPAGGNKTIEIFAPSQSPGTHVLRITLEQNEKRLFFQVIKKPFHVSDRSMVIFKSVNFKLEIGLFS